MKALDQQKVCRVEIWPVDIPITDPFVVATGRLFRAQNLFVRVTLNNGVCGYGEIAPFPDVSGEDRSSCFVAAKELATNLLGQSVWSYRRCARMFRETAPFHAATWCGFETAVVDALCRAAALPLWALWGGADLRQRETDITIPITDLDRTLALAQHWYQQGFRVFKMKVGLDADQDVRRLEAIHRNLSDVRFIVDSNQGFSHVEVIEFAKGVQLFGGTIMLLEQPLPREDLEGLAALRHELKVPIAADESVRSLEDAKTVVRYHAADFVNIKITKSGVLEALEIATYARAAGLELMIGGMVESRLAMGCSFSLVLGLGGFNILDLDTPLLLAEDIIHGGYQYQGAYLFPWWDAGLGMELKKSADCVTIE